MVEVRRRGRLPNGLSNGPDLPGMGEDVLPVLLPKKVPDVRLRLAGETGSMIPHDPAIQNAVLRESERPILQWFFDLVGKTQADPFFFLECADDLEWSVVHLDIGPIVAKADEIPPVRSPLQAPMPCSHDPRVPHQLPVVPELAEGIEPDATSLPGMADRFAHNPMVPRLRLSCRKWLRLRGDPRSGPSQARGRPSAARRRRSRAR